jgi:hypothetical protein
MFTFGLLPLPEAASYVLMAIAIAILWAITSRPARPVRPVDESAGAASRLLSLLALANFTNRANPPSPAFKARPDSPLAKAHFEPHQPAQR